MVLPFKWNLFSSFAEYLHNFYYNVLFAKIKQKDIYW